MMLGIKNIFLGAVLLTTVSALTSCKKESNPRDNAIVKVKIENVPLEALELLTSSGCIGSSWLYKERVTPGMLISLARHQMNAPANTSEINTELMRAVADIYGDTYDEVKRLLDSNVDINEASTNGCTALMWAIVFKRRDILSLLLDEGADIEQADTKGTTPLMFAALAKDLEIFRILLDEGADFNAAQTGGKNEIGTTVLHHAVSRKDNLAIVKLLIKQGADVNAANETGRTPLLKAVTWGGVEYIALLLDAGAELSHISNVGTTVLHEAILPSGENLEMIKLLISKGADVTATNNRGETPLISAAKWGHLDYVRLLVDTGSDIKRESNSGQTALDFARLRKRSHVVTYLESLE